MRKLSLLIMVLFVGTGAAANDVVKFRGVAEFGMLSVLSHTIQFGNNGTAFDYVEDGGQEMLFPVSRYSVEMDIGKKNTFILLYQPLALQTQSLLENELVVDSLAFPARSSVKFLYGFPFYRASWLRELLSDDPHRSLELGLTLQVRNATISFESADGTLFRTNRDVGIVPALKARGSMNFDRFFVGFEADGIYAPVSYLNGSDNEVEGAILDASIRGGAAVRNDGTVFVNLRYLGGGATGTSTGDVWPGDGYVKNWLHFLTVTTGYVHQF